MRSTLCISLPSLAMPSPLIPLQIMPYSPNFLLAPYPALRLTELLQVHTHVLASPTALTLRTWMHVHPLRLPQEIQPDPAQSPMLTVRPCKRVIRSRAKPVSPEARSRVQRGDAPSWPAPRSCSRCPGAPRELLPYLGENTMRFSHRFICHKIGNMESSWTHNPAPEQECLGTNLALTHEAGVARQGSSMLLTEGTAALGMVEHLIAQTCQGLGKGKVHLLHLSMVGSIKDLWDTWTGVDGFWKIRGYEGNEEKKAGKFANG